MTERTWFDRRAMVKITGGLAIDPQLAHDNTLAIVRRANELGGFVRIDMEDSPYTDATLDLYRALRDAGFTNIGVVVQAYLKRSRDDVAALCAIGARVRIVKGIYIEPEAIAYKDMRVINRNFVALCRMLVEAGCHVAIATHDEAIVHETQRMVDELRVPRDMYEYQMLLGVREQLRDELLANNHPVRVYVPFGAQWYEYSIRRLRENPRVAGHVTADVFATVRRSLGLGGGGRGRRGKRTPLTRAAQQRSRTRTSIGATSSTPREERTPAGVS